MFLPVIYVTKTPVYVSATNFIIPEPGCRGTLLPTLLSKYNKKEK